MPLMQRGTLDLQQVCIPDYAGGQNSSLASSSLMHLGTQLSYIIAACGSCSLGNGHGPITLEVSRPFDMHDD